MVIPRLIHPVQVTVKVNNRNATRMDPETREPIQRVKYHGEITLPGQLRESLRKRDVDMERGGRNERETGYVLFRTIDLDTALKNIGSSYEEWANGANGAANDRITRAGNQAMNAFITRIDPLGHYSDQGGATLVKAYFTDRAPARRTGGA